MLHTLLVKYEDITRLPRNINNGKIYQVIFINKN